MIGNSEKSRQVFMGKRTVNVCFGTEILAIHELSSNTVTDQTQSFSVAVSAITFQRFGTTDYINFKAQLLRMLLWLKKTLWYPGYHLMYQTTTFLKLLL